MHFVLIVTKKLIDICFKYFNLTDDTIPEDDPCYTDKEVF